MRLEARPFTFTRNSIPGADLALGGSCRFHISLPHQLHADDMLSAFVELEREALTVTFYLESIRADS